MLGCGSGPFPALVVGWWWWFECCSAAAPSTCRTSMVLNMVLQHNAAKSTCPGEELLNPDTCLSPVGLLDGGTGNGSGLSGS